MTDVLTPAQRRLNMSRIKGQNTTPERIVRSTLFSLGYRYRLHRKDLPGKPDLVFPSRRKVIFVNGCYWHMHDCKYGNVTPKTNADFWQTKRLATVARDARQIDALTRTGWEVLVVWECETRNREGLQAIVQEFLGPPGKEHAVQ